MRIGIKLAPIDGVFGQVDIGFTLHEPEELEVGRVGGPWSEQPGPDTNLWQICCLWDDLLRSAAMLPVVLPDWRGLQVAIRRLAKNHSVIATILNREAYNIG